MKKRILSIVLSVLIIWGFTPSLENNMSHAVISFTNLTAEYQEPLSFNGSSSTLYYKIKMDGPRETAKYGIRFKCTQVGGSPKITRINQDGSNYSPSTSSYMNTSNRFDITGVSYGEYIYFKVESSLSCKFTITMTICKSNTDSFTASQIYDNTSVLNFNEMTYRASEYSFGNLWYYIEPEQTAKYKLYSSDFSPIKAAVITPEGGEYSISINDVKDTNASTVYTVNKGQRLYIRMVSDVNNRIFYLYRDSANVMQDFGFESDIVTATVNTTKSVKLKFSLPSPSQPMESTIKNNYVYMYYSNGNLASYFPVIKSGNNMSFNLSFNQPGLYSLKATNSEGLVAQGIAGISPSKMSTTAIKSIGTHKSTSISWPAQTGANRYYVYMATSKSGTYKYKGYTTNTACKISGLKSNKSYYIKIAPAIYGTINGESYVTCGMQSDPVKVITAPSKAPKLKSAKVTKTKYTKSKKVWVPGRWDANGVWHDGYYSKTAAYSIVYVKVSKTSISGASYYQGNGYDSKISNNTVQYKYSGKVKSGKKISVKVRAVKKSGNSIAYGPWSKSKSIKVH